MRLIVTLLILFYGFVCSAQDSCYSRPLLDVLSITRNADSIQLLLKAYTQGFIGCKAPQLDCTTLSGKRFTTEKLAGKVTVLNFWFTHCKPCIGEFESLNKLVDEYATQGVEFISFAMDKPAVLDTFLVTHHLKYNVVPTANSTVADFKICSYPSNIVLDKNWRVMQVVTGGESENNKMKNYTKLKELIDRALAK